MCAYPWGVDNKWCCIVDTQNLCVHGCCFKHLMEVNKKFCCISKKNLEVKRDLPGKMKFDFDSSRYAVFFESLHTHPKKFRPPQ